MMHNLTLNSLPTAAVAAGLVAALSLTGCEFLGFGDDDIVEIDNSENSASNQQTGEGVETVTLFDEEVEVVDHATEDIVVDVPENAYSLAITVTGGSGLVMYGVSNWRHEEGFQLVPDGWETGNAQICFQDCNNRITLGASAFGAVAPNNPDSEVEPGEYRFNVFGTSMQQGFINELPSTQQNSPPEMRVTVHAKVTYDDVPETGTLNINAFFSGANGWTADSAADDEEFQNMIDEIDEIYAQVGIELGEISYHDVDSGYEVIEDLTTGSGDMSEMFEESERATVEGPSVFFVSELRSPFGGGGGGILGIAGGIPGPMLVDGSARGGVAIATDSIQTPGAPSMAHVVAHELGHYMGLFHTTENFQIPGQPGHDPLPDTPEDDPTLLMHASGSGDIMSEWQGRVFRNNPWVKH